MMGYNDRHYSAFRIQNGVIAFHIVTSVRPSIIRHIILITPVYCLSSTVRFEKVRTNIICGFFEHHIRGFCIRFGTIPTFRTVCSSAFGLRYPEDPSKAIEGIGMIYIM
jgi:hypothetical protein